MITRSNKNLLNKGRGANGSEPVWVLVGIDLKPCDPSNNKVASSEAWFEMGGDLQVKASPTTDDFFTYTNGDLIAKPI